MPNSARERVPTVPRRPADSKPKTFDSKPEHIERQGIQDFYKPSRHQVGCSNWSIAGACLTIGLQFFDIVSDLSVAFFVRYGTNFWHFLLTLTFVFIPNYCLNGLLSIVQNKLYRRSRKGKQDYLEVSRCNQVLRWVLYGFCLNSATTEIEYLCYARNRPDPKTDPIGHKKSTSAMAASKLQGSVVRVLEALFEAAPQLVLQLYIEMSSGYDFNLDVSSWTWKSWLLVVSSTFSLLSVVWNVRIFYATHRQYHDEVELKIGHQIIMFSGRLLMIASRVAAFVAIAKVHWILFLVFAAIHLTFVDGYMKWIPGDRSDTSVMPPYHGEDRDLTAKTDSHLIFILSRLSYFFIDVDVQWLKYTEQILPYKLVLYFVFLMENAAMLWIWFLFEGSEQQGWICATFGGVGIGGYFFGCLLMMLFTVCSRKPANDKN